MCGGLKEGETIHGGKFLPVFIANFPFIFEVDFIANQHNLHFFVAVIFNFVEPAVDILKRIPFGDIIHQKGCDRSS